MIKFADMKAVKKADRKISALYAQALAKLQG